MKKLFLIFVLLPLLTLYAGNGIGENDVCQSSPAFVWNGTSIGGLWLPSSGTIKVLFILLNFRMTSMIQQIQAGPKVALPQL